MKKIIPICILAMTIIVSCGKLPENGDLDGMWQLMEMSEKASEGEHEYINPINKKDEAIYWSFQLKMMMIHCPKTQHNGRTYYTSGRFIHTGKTLDITEMYVHFFDRDSLIDDANTTLLEPVGVHGNKTTYRIEQLNDHRMILQSDYNRLVFRKF